MLVSVVFIEIQQKINRKIQSTFSLNLKKIAEIKIVWKHKKTLYEFHENKCTLQ